MKTLHVFTESLNSMVKILCLIFFDTVNRKGYSMKQALAQKPISTHPETDTAFKALFGSLSKEGDGGGYKR
jgi:hypothetical protein